MTPGAPWRRVGSSSMVVAAVLGVVGVGGFLSVDDKPAQTLGAGLLVAVCGLAGVVWHPRIVYGALAFVLGAIPFGVLPGIGIPMVLIFGVAFWAALLTHPITETRTSGLEVAVVLLVVTSLAAFIMTADSTVHYFEFAKWLLATSLVFGLLRLDRADLRTFGVVYAYGVGLAAAFGLAVFVFDKAGSSLDYLSVIGYGQTGVVGTHLRFYVADNSSVVRLTGTYVDPNAAGIFLLVGFALSVALLRGWQRLLMAALIITALVVTLSRSALLSVVVGVVLFVLFQRMTTGRRLAIVVAAIVATSAALSRPTIYSRIFTSFSSTDKGSVDRAKALADYPSAMSGTWWWGRGWGAPEFTNEQIGYKTNYVANSPLLSVYRGGIFVGIAFVLILVVGAVYAYRNARRSPWESGVTGAMFVGFSLVGLQLDFPVVTNASMAMAFSVLIAFVAANPIERPPRADDPAPESTHSPPLQPPRGSPEMVDHD